MEPSFTELISQAVPVDLLFTCITERWRPKIGDPSLMGWMTVGVYLLAAFAARRTARRGAFPPETFYRERRFWTALFILMICMAINKQLDLQSLLTATGRCTAKLQGWYGMRWGVQRAFVFTLAAFSAGLGILLFYLMRDTLRRTGLALLGTTVVFGFVLVRAVGFHHVDTIINFKVSSVRMNWVLELTGLVLILLATALHPQARKLRKARRRRTKQFKTSESHDPVQADQDLELPKHP